MVIKGEMKQILTVSILSRNYSNWLKGKIMNWLELYALFVQCCQDKF